MSNLITISGVRGFVDENDVAQLNLEDVSRGLGFTQTKNGVEYVRWERVNGYLENMGFPHLAGKEFIPENVFYRLGMKGENEAAQQFQIKVADEILPSIRRHGMYATDSTIENILTNPDFGIQLLTALKTERAEKKRLTEKIEQDAPKVSFADAVASSETSIPVGDLAKLLKQNGINTGQNRLFEYLRQNGYLVKYGDSRNIPTQKYMEMGLFEIKESTVYKPNGNILIQRTPKITGKGQIYFVKLFRCKSA